MGRSLVVTLFLLTLLPIIAFAQEKAPATSKDGRASRLNPPDVLSGLVNLGSVSLAKTHEDGKSLRAIVPRIEVSTRTHEIEVTKMRQESRTRTVTNDEGKPQVQEYTVCVPYTETMTTTVTVPKIAAKQRMTIPAEQIRAWRLNGEALSAQDLLKQAGKPIHFFAHRSLVPFKGVDPYYAQVLSPKAVVIFVGHDFAEKFADEK